MIALVALVALLAALVGYLMALFTMDTGPDWVGGLGWCMITVGLWVGIPAAVIGLLLSVLTTLGVVS